MNSEKGQILPLVLVTLAVGTLFIVPFLGHASTGFIVSRVYEQAITEQYSAGAGVEHAIWRLTNDGLADELSVPGDSANYTLSETVNSIAPSITVTALDSSDGSYIYALRGDNQDNQKDFWRYDIANDEWTSMANTPEQVKEGGALTHDGSNYIYAFRGNDQKDFWRYDIANDEWTSMANTPEQVNSGGALTLDGSNIYALRGDNQKDFWRYDIANDEWTSMANAPNKVKEGGALTYDGSYIYALRGNDKKNFWRYDITNDAWAHMANTPEKVKEGGALASNIVTSTFNEYEIVSTASDNVIRAVVRIEGETVSILSWEVE